jgi:hypothetical protein
MQAPHPPQEKTAKKNKVWAKKTLKNNIGQSMDFFEDSPNILGSP